MYICQPQNNRFLQGMRLWKKVSIKNNKLINYKSTEIEKSINEN